KQFKSDSARLAFLVWVEFSVFGGQVKCRGSVLHTLIGRYATGQKNLLCLSFSLSLAIGFSVSAIYYCRPKFLNFSSRKTCQISWVASLVFSVGSWRIWLAQSVARASLSVVLLRWSAAALSFSKQKLSHSLKFAISHLLEVGL
ncbi:hypothetical protein, partial [Vibrio aestuarianus]|uniref:hypothetical protein n=1 Tax=Vibrio aestuarianus TaxID=28171 RepID=UPI0030B887F8